MTELLFNSDRAFMALKKLALEIGPRPAGSAAEVEAVQYLTKEFESLGLKTTLQEFEVMTGKVLSKRLEVIDPYHEEIACEAMALMGDTGPEGVEGELFHLETTDEEYLTPEITDKIVVTRARVQTKNLGLISMLKPLGFILIEAYPRVLPKHLWGNKERWEKYGNFPTVRISYEDGVKLLGLGAKRALLVVESQERKMKSKNVIGELEGKLRPDKVVIVGGHFDSVPGVMGASDNAGGMALVLELARVFKEKGSKRTLRFIAWGNEEMGLAGSHHYAHELKKTSEKMASLDEESEQDRIKLVVNLDVHGALLGTNEVGVLGPSDLTAAVKLLSKEVGTVFNVKEGEVYSSDGTSLSSVGIPSVTFSRCAGSDIMMHSVEDTMQWLSPIALKVQGEFVELFLTRYVTEAAAFPFEKEIPEKQKKDIEKYYRERLKTPP